MRGLFKRAAFPRGILYSPRIGAIGTPTRHDKRRSPVTLETERARDLRAHQTEAEALLWSELRGRRCNGWKFRRQVPLKGYIADFLCAEAKLIVELDGGQHADSAYDRVRDARLNEAGYRILRFWNDEVIQQREWTLERIIGAVEGRE